MATEHPSGHDRPQSAIPAWPASVECAPNDIPPVANSGGGMCPISEAAGNSSGYPPQFWWRSHASGLAQWAMARLVNRSDCWVGYLPLEARQTEHDKSRTFPREADRVDGALNPWTLYYHFCGWDVGHLIALHAIGRDNRSRWFGIDVDAHDERADPGANFRAACGWWDKLRGMRLAPLLLDSNGAGGFHVIGVLAEPIRSDRLFHFVHEMVSDFLERGLTQKPETFPKQPRIDEHVRFGSALRVPGRHHSRDHWTRAWLGDRWGGARETVEMILRTGGDSAEVIPAVTPNLAVRTQTRPTGAWGEAKSRSSAGARPVEYWLNLLRGVRKTQRHEATVQLAGYLLGRHVGPHIALGLLIAWYGQRNEPPLDRSEVVNIVHDIAVREGQTEQNLRGLGVMQGHGHQVTLRDLTVHLLNRGIAPPVVEELVVMRNIATHELASEEAVRGEVHFYAGRM